MRWETVVNRALEWLELMSNQIPHGRATQSNHPTRVARSTTRAGGQWARGDVQVQVFVDFTSHAIKAPGLTLALAKASLEEEVPLEWRLLLRGEKAVLLNDYRVAVVEAASAVEQVVSSKLLQVVADETSGTGEKLLGSLPRAADSWTEARSLPEARTVAPSTRDETKSGRQRNKVLHEGHPATEGEARTALEIARQILSDAAPALPGVTDLIERPRDVLGGH